MTQIDFYILNSSFSLEREKFACRLVEKAYKLGHRIFVQVADQDQQSTLDKLLWTFRQGSFVPHDLDTSTESESTPVVIGYEGQAIGQREVLVNLSNDIPQNYRSYDRMTEIVDQTSSTTQSARERFRFYRDQGLEIKTHQVN